MIKSECLEYRALPLQFYIFTFSGVWCPNDWKSLLKRLYHFYTAILVVAGVVFWLTMLINIIVTKTESELFYQNLFAISTLTYAMYKEFFVLRKRKEIIDILKLTFDDGWYQPQNDFEIEVTEKYEYETRWITQLYAVGIVAGLATKAITPMIKSNEAWVLPIEAWYPYNVNNLINYLLTYVQQLIGGVPLICLHISVDTLFVGLVLQMCIQLELLKYRLENFMITSDENVQQEKTLLIDNMKVDDKIANFAHKHDCLLRTGNQINTDFRGIMTGQVMITIPNICINVYLLSQHRGGITMNLVDSFLCFATCLMQIFLYCWYGNKIINCSMDISSGVYDMNWPFLDVSARKKLLTIMIRTTRSIQFATGTFIMNINSFIEIIRTSYSAFRVLQRT